MAKGTVIVKSVDKHRWSGYHRFPKCKDTVIAQYGRAGYATGLTEEEEKELEKKLSLQNGTLNKYSTYWRDYTIVLTDKQKTLKLENPKDYLDYKILFASKRVANSVNDLSLTPKAEYVLYDAEEDAKKDNLVVKEKRKAYKKFSSLTTKEMRDVLKLMGKRAENASDTLVENTLNDIIEKDPKEFNTIIGIADFKTRVFIEDLVAINALRIRGGHYMFGDNPIGHDIETAVGYLKSPKNQDIVLSLKSKLQASKKSK
jgi:hypothetical protein